MTITTVLFRNVCDEVDFSKVYLNYFYKVGKHTYSRKILLHLVLMGAFDGELSGRYIVKAAADVSYVIENLPKKFLKK